jgi:hypothetical protein
MTEMTEKTGFAWTQHASGDLEIEMPDGGPTARITEDEHGGPETWSAYVFPDAETSTYSEHTGFASAVEAREWAETRLLFAAYTRHCDQGHVAHFNPAIGAYECKDGALVSNTGTVIKSCA